MRLFFAYSADLALNVLHEICKDKKIKVNMLNSFEYIKALTPEVSSKIVDKWFIFDSGAFTVWKTGGEVNIKEYISACLKLKEFFGEKLICINLDVIPGRFGVKPTKDSIEDSCKRSYENYLYLKQELKGIKIMPVFHQYDNWHWLDTYLKDDCYLLGISPANDVTVKARGKFLDVCFSKIRDTKRCHGLGVLSPKLLKGYPFYSADATTWVVTAAYGGIMLMNRIGKMSLVHYTNKPKIIANNATKYVDDRAKKDLRYLSRCKHNALSFLKLEKFVTELWKKRGVIWED